MTNEKVNAMSPHNGKFDGFKIVCNKCGAEAKTTDTHYDMAIDGSYIGGISIWVRCLKCGNRSPEYCISDAVPKRR